MMHRTSAATAASRRIAVTAFAAIAMFAGSPAVAVSSAAEEPGLHRQVPATFGDCKNHNSGLHNGYDCLTLEEQGGEQSAG
jgi:hypothetical protein